MLGVLFIEVRSHCAIAEPQAARAGRDGMNAGDILRPSQALRGVVPSAVRPVHPEDDRSSGAAHAMWCDEPGHSVAHARHDVLCRATRVDRSPCGTGSSARMAQQALEGQLS